MRISVVLILCVSILQGDSDSKGVAPPCEWYKPALVRSWVELPPEFAQGSTFIEKDIYRAGDLFASGVVQSFDQRELLDAGRIRRLLPLIRLSFSQPQFIESEAAKKPRVTLLLLYFLWHRRAGKEEQREIAVTYSFVCTQTKLECPEL